MRNPYRFSFDRKDGRLFLADVGQNLFEEINVVEKGGNYGWVTREGFACFDPFDPVNPPAACATTGPAGEPLLDPIAAYDHFDGIAVVGGFVYRGSSFPELRGKYVFGDFSRTFFPGSGRLFYLDAGADTPQIFEFRIGQEAAPLARYLFGFGEDEAGEIYVGTSLNLGPTGDTGEVYRIARVDHITLCHGNRAGGLRTITVGPAAVDAHLAHGDAFGACGEDEPMVRAAPPCDTACAMQAVRSESNVVGPFSPLDSRGPRGTRGRR